MLSFLKKLAKNNNREWFAANKPQYELAHKEVEQLATRFIADIGAFDNSIALLEPRQCTFRIYRDARFSHDKTPYKTNFGFAIQQGGKKTPFAGYYVHIEPGSCFLSGGVYMPQPPVLKALRDLIDDRFEEFQSIITRKEFKKYFGGLMTEDALVNVPRGFDKNSPAAQYLKMKHYFVLHAVSDKQVEDKNFVTEALPVLRAVHPFIQFLNATIAEVELGDERD